MKRDTRRYLSTDEDKRVAAGAIRLTRRIVLETEALKRYEPEEYTPGASYPSDAELVDAAGKIGTTIFHPVGTCRMGRDSDTSAGVDTRFRVRGSERLRIIDASIIRRLRPAIRISPRW